MNAIVEESECPMPGCGEMLRLIWEGWSELPPLAGPDAAPAGQIAVDSCVSVTWKVECDAGHVLLLPDPQGCPCEHEMQGTEDCPHDPDDFEWSEEGPHIFRVHDQERLAVTISRLTVPVTG